jgi:hypothetical protein
MRINKTIRDQYEMDLVYLSGGAPKWRGSLGEFIGDSIGFVFNYIGESRRNPEQAREEVMRRKKSLQDWLDYQPKSSNDIKIVSIPLFLKG